MNETDILNNVLKDIYFKLSDFLVEFDEKFKFEIFSDTYLPDQTFFNASLNSISEIVTFLEKSL